MISGSRTALVVGVVAAALTALLVTRGIGRLALLAVVAIVLAGGGVAGAALTGRSAGQREETDALGRFDQSSASGRVSSRARDDLRERAFDQIQERPLTGVGFQEIKVAHTIYLQLWASGGLLAFSAFVLFAGGGLVVGWRLIRQRSLTSPERRLALALGVSFCGWLAAGLVSNVLTDGYVYVALALLLAIWVGHGRGEHASDRRPDATHHPAPIAGGSAPA
jgi:O-antigen ligase